MSSIFDALQRVGHDMDFEPQANELFFPTMFGPGSDEKIEVLRQRVELGLPLWHPKDEPVCRKAGVGGDKSSSGATYGKTALMFATRLNKTLSE